MKLQSFLKLVEIQTKVASVLPFLVGLAFVYYRYGTIKVEQAVWMFISLLCIDMATTSINNFMDYKKAVKKDGYGYEVHNSIVKYGLSEKAVVGTILVLLGIAVLSGIVLVLKTNLVVLAAGTIAFGIGILYSYGPFPISRTPFGEIFSGGVMGLIIPFLAVYIHVFERNIISYELISWRLNVSMDIKELAVIFFMALPMVFGISNIMLANNICDVDDDVVNKRYTLVYYIGKPKALLVFKLSYMLAYVDIVVLMVLNILPMTAIVALITAVPVRGFIETFYEKQVKSETFVLAVKGFVMITGLYLVGIVAGIIL